MALIYTPSNVNLILPRVFLVDLPSIWANLLLCGHLFSVGRAII